MHLLLNCEKKTYIHSIAQGCEHVDQSKIVKDIAKK